MHGRAHREQRRLRIARLMDQLADSTTRFGEHNFTQRNLEVGIEGFTYVVDTVGEDVVVFVEFATHAGVLGALAG